MPSISSMIKLAPWVIIAALVVTVLWVNTERMQVEADRVAATTRAEGYKTRLETAVQVNAQQLQTIDRLTQTRAANDALLLSLSGSLEKIANDNEVTRTDIRNLERTNAQVRDYLDNRLPPELGSVLNRRAAGGAGQD